MRIKKGFVLRDVCGEKVVVGESVENIDFSQLITLNPTAAWLWCTAENQCEFTVDSLVETLLKEYDVEETRARADVARIVEKWVEVGVVSTDKE